MLKILRKIRRELLDESRIGKYLTYAFGEIVLVVIGILIALQLNNYNSSQSIRASAEEHLKVMAEDLEKDRAKLNQLILNVKSQLEAANRILVFYKGSGPYNATLASDLVEIVIENNFKSTRNGISILVNSGEIAVLDQDVQTLISEWTTHSEFILDRENISNGFIQRNYEPLLLNRHNKLLGKGNGHPIFDELYQDDIRPDTVDKQEYAIRKDRTLEMYVFARRYQSMEQLKAYQKGVQIIDSLLNRM